MTEATNKTQLEFTVQNNTKAGLQEIKNDVRGVADAAAQAGQRAGGAFDGMSKSSQGAAGTIDKTSQSIIRSIEREVAALQAGGKSTAAYYEAIAKQRGADMNALGPYLQQMRLVEKQAEQSLQTMGVSAKQTAAAMRGVPAQFTDIFVSLQGGQAPLTVFLQQGGQLKDMFGGAGAAAKALGGYVLGLVNPFTIAAAAIGTLAVAYYQGSKEQDAFVRSLTMTGNAVGMTTDQLRAYSREISESVGTQGRAAQALVAFIDAGMRGNEQLQEYAKTAMEWESVTGQSVTEVAKQFKELQEDPLKAVVKLNEGMNFLTVSVYEQIKSLEEQGKKTKAAQVAMDALNSTMKERSAEIKQNLGYLEAAWSKLGNTASKVWDMMLGVGRAATLADKIGGLRDDIAAMEKQLAEGKGFGNTAGGAATGRGNAALTQQDIKLLQERIALRKEELVALEKTAKADQEAAEQKAKEAEAVKARIAINEKYADALKVEMTLSQKLAQARKDAADAGWDEEKLKRVLAHITEEHNKQNREGNAGRKAAESAYKSLTASIRVAIANLEKERDAGEKLTVVEKLRLQYMEQLTTKGKQFTVEEQKKIEALLDVAQAAQEQAAAAHALAKAWDDDAKALDAHIKKQEAQIASVISSAQKLHLEEEAHLLAQSANISHAEAVERLTIARLEEAHAQMLAGAGSQEEIERINREIEARKKLLGLLGQKAAREANAKAAKDAAKEWDRTAQTIGDTLADYIMGGGKDAATYLKRLFSTLVLQPVVQTVVGGVMGTGAAAASGAASGGLMDRLSNSAGGFTNWSSWGSGASNLAYDASLKSLEWGMNSTAKSFVSLGNSIQSVDTWLKDIPGMSGGIGSAAGYLGAIYSLSQGNYGSAIGSAIGTWALPGIGTMIGSTLGSLVDGAFGGGTDDYGAAAKYAGGTLSNTGKQYTAQELTKSYSEGLQAPMDSLARTIGGSLDGLANLFKQQGGYSVQTGFTSDNDDPSRGIFIVQNAVGETLEKWLHYRSGEFGQRATGYSYAKDPEKGYDEYLKSVTAATIPIFKEIVPAWADSMLDNLSASLGLTGAQGDWKNIESGSGAMQALQQVIQQIAMVEAGFESLGKAMAVFADLSGDMKSALIGSFGSMEALTAAASSYYQTYYSEAERMQTLREQVNARLEELGVSLGNSLDAFDGEAAIAAFRRNLEEARATGQGELVAAMLAINQEFATAAQYAQKLANAVDTVGDAMSDTMRDLLAEQRSLQAELLRASGDQAGYSAMQRDIATTGMTADEKAQWDANEALRRQIEAAEASARAAAQAQTDYARAMEEAARAAEQARVAAISAALGVVESVIGRDKQYWDAISQGAQKAVSSITSVMDTLEQRIRELYGSVQSTARMQAVEGMLYVEQALAGVRAGQSVLSYKLLDVAAAAAQTGINSGAYTSQFERDRDALRLAAQLSEINAYAVAQKTLEEQLLDASREQSSALQEALEYYRALVNGIDYIGGYSREQLRALSEGVENTQYFYGALSAQQAQSTAAITQATQGVASAVAGQADQFASVAGAVNAGTKATQSVASAVTAQASQFTGVANAVQASGEKTAQAIAGQSGQFASVANAVQASGTQTAQAIASQSTQFGIVAGAVQSSAAQTVSATNAVASAIQGQSVQFGSLTNATRDVTAAISGQSGQFAGVASAVQQSGAQTAAAIAGQSAQFGVVADAVRTSAAQTVVSTDKVAGAVSAQAAQFSKVAQAVQSGGAQTVAAIAGQAAQFTNLTDATRSVSAAIAGQASQFASVTGAVQATANQTAQAIAGQSSQFAGVTAAVNSGTQATQGVAAAINGQLGQFTNLTDATRSIGSAITGQASQFTGVATAVQASGDRTAQAIAGQAAQFSTIAGAVQTSAAQTVAATGMVTSAIRGQASQFAGVATAVQQGTAATQNASLEVARAVLGQYTLLGQVSSAVQTTGTQSAREISAALAGQSSLFAGVTGAIGQGTEATRFVYEAIGGQVAVSTEIRDALLGLASKEAEQSGVPAWATEEISLAKQQLGQLVTIEHAILSLKSALAVPSTGGGSGSSSGGSVGGGSSAGSFNLASEVSIWRDAISSASVAGEASKANLYKTMAKYYTDAQIREIVTKVSGVQSNSNWQALKNLAGMPHYAVGANYIPNDQVAVLHKGEAVVPKAFNPWADGKGFGINTERLERLVEQQTAYIQKLEGRLQAIERNTGELRDMTENVTEGGNAMRVEVMA